MIKNKVYQSCNANLVAFLQERDPTTLTELTKLGDQYYLAHPNVKLQKDIPFQAFASEDFSEGSEDEITDAYAAHARMRPSHQGRSMERCGGRHPNQFPLGHSSSKQRPNPVPPTQQVKQDVSNPRGNCLLYGSWKHQMVHCPYKH